MTCSSAELLLLFPTPILVLRLANVEQLNSGLERFILTMEASSPSMKQSNVGGWQSEKTLQQSDAPVVVELMTRIVEGVHTYYDLAAKRDVTDKPDVQHIILWANVNRAHHFNAPHHHGRAFLSGIYYTATVSDYTTGQLEGIVIFRDPTRISLIAAATSGPQSLKALYPQQLSFSPEPGLMLIFPSWLDHWVTPHMQPRPRISFAFDVRF